MAIVVSYLQKGRQSKIILPKLPASPSGRRCKSEQILTANTNEYNAALTKVNNALIQARNNQQRN